MAQKMLIDATHPEETRVVVVDGNKVDDFDFESINKRQLSGNIYLAKVTRVEPSLQAAFIDYGGNRHGFLAFAEIHPDYYQIPVADREAIVAEEEQAARAQADAEEREDEGESGGGRKRRGRRSASTSAPEAPAGQTDDATTAKAEPTSGRRRRRERGPRTQDTSAALEVIDLAEPAAGAPETTSATPAGLEVEDPVGDTSALAGGAAGSATPVADDTTAADTTAADTRAADTRAAPDAPAAQAGDASGETSAAGEATGETGDTTDDDTPNGPRSMAEASGLEDDTVSEDVASLRDGAAPASETRTKTEAAEATGTAAPASADAPEAGAAADEASERPEAASGDAGSEADDGNGGTSAKRGRGRRGRGRNRDKDRGDRPAETEAEAAPAPRGRRDGNGNDDDEGGSEATEVETAGAEDMHEEVSRERAIRRRRYKIQDVIKVRQILLVQVVKEERGNKGAALTTYLSLAGRYCVLMPNTARGGGISRKITNAPDRKRLREVVGELELPQGMGLIVRTAGAERTRPEIRRDYDFLLRQWEQIRELTLKSIAPTLIYEEGSLIKRSIRDLYSKDIDTILVEGDAGYREAKDYMKMLMPSHAKNVQQYSDSIPLFIRYQVESYLNGMFSPVVQLKSGGYIVIGITEALVAIDINSGRSTKEGSIEETALKTNLEASDEIARQLRLRDLAGLIVIDYIDMDENRNNRAVEKRLKERLKNDRARIQIGRISAFGLLEMSRQRLRPGMLEASTAPCPHCHGTGTIRSDESLSLAILRELEEASIRDRTTEVTVTAPVEIANFLINSKRAHIARIEDRHGVRVQVFGDPLLTTPKFTVETVRGAAGTTVPARPSAAVITAETAAAEVEPTAPPAALAVPAAAAQAAGETSSDDADGSDGDGKRRRRGKRGGKRRRNRDGTGPDGDGETAASAEVDAGSAQGSEDAGQADSRDEANAANGDDEGGSGTGRRRRSRGGQGRRRGGASGDAADATSEVASGEANQATSADAETSGPAPAEAAVETRADAGPTQSGAADEGLTATDTGSPAPDTAGDAAPTQPGPVPAGSAATAAPEPAAAASDTAPADTADTPDEAPELEVAAASRSDEARPEPAGRSKRKGWWSFKL